MQHPGLGFPGKVSNHKTCSIKQEELECRKPTLAGWERGLRPVLGREEPQAVRSRDCAALCPSGTRYPCCSAPWGTNMSIIRASTAHISIRTALHTSPPGVMCFTNTLASDNKCNEGGVT